MKKFRALIINLGVWLAYAVCFAVGLLLLKSVEEKNPSVNHDFYGHSYFGLIAPFLGLIIVPGIIAFYSFYIFLFSKMNQKKKWYELLFWILLICSFCGLISLGISGLVVFPNFIKMSTFTNLAIYSFAASIFSLIHGAVGLIIKAAIVYFDEIKVRDELVAKNHQMEMTLIKQQLNPHFLFNTINNIDVLIAKDPTLASKYLNELSEIMRFMLYETKASKIDLSQELEYIQKYLDLQKIRSSNPNFIEYQVVGSNTNFKIAPALFIPFIENAIKHTQSRIETATVKIRIDITNNQISLSCSNPLSNESNPLESNLNEGGVGNQLIQRRLQLLYPQSHTLVITKDQRYTVQLTISNR